MQEKKAIFAEKILKMNMDYDKSELIAKVESALDTIRPHLVMDHGDVELVEITDDMVAKIRWTGMCESCSMSAMTLRAGIYEAVRSAVPQIKAVEAVNGVFAA